MSKLDLRVDKEAVLKHDDIVRLGREFGGLKESRFLNWAEPHFPPINLYNLPYQPVTPDTIKPLTKTFSAVPDTLESLYKLRSR
jgi:hypothetical protein